MEKKCGHYLGTVVDLKWWRRDKTPGYEGSGLGEFWFEGNTFFFSRPTSETPVTIPCGYIEAVRLGKWHAGRWGSGSFVVKIDWHQDGGMMSSGFIFSSEGLEVLGVMQKLERLAKEARRNGAGYTPSATPWQEELDLHSPAVEGC